MLGRQPVKVRADFDIDGNPIPLKFKIVTEEKSIVTVKVDKIIKRNVNTFAGNKMLVYYCESADGDVSRPYELRYEIDTCKWFFYY